MKKSLRKPLAGLGILLVGLTLLTFIGCSEDSESKTWTVRFDKNNNDNGSTNAIPAEKKASDGGTIGSLPAEPTRSNYRFNGWNMRANGSGSEFTASTVVTADITVYAQWIALQATVTFNKNAPEHAPATTEASPPSITVDNTTGAGSVGTLPSQPVYDPTWNAGVTFGGWYTAETGGTEFTASTPVTRDITVYARWNYAAGTPAVSGDTLVQDNPAIETSGGVVNGDGSATYSSGYARYQFPAAYADYDFFAVDYISTGGVSVILKRYNDDGDYPPRTGGIYLTLQASGNVAFEIKKASGSGGLAMTLNNSSGTVKFSKVTFTKGTRHAITFNIGYAGGETFPNTYGVEGTAIDADLPTPTARNGYNFAGWFDQADNKIINTSIIEGPLNLTGRWMESVTVNPLTVNFSDAAVNLRTAGRNSAAATVEPIENGAGYHFKYGGNYDGSYVIFTITLPAGASLADYASVSFTIQGNGTGTNYKHVFVLAGAPLPDTFASTPEDGAYQVSPKLDDWNYGTGSRDFTLVIDAGKGSSLTGNVDVSIYERSDNSNTSEWDVRNVVFNPKS